MIPAVARVTRVTAGTRNEASNTMSSATAPILVTGATGTVGAEVVRQLRERGAPVRLATRHPAPSVSGAEAVVFDFLEPASWRPAFTGVERLFLVRPPAISDVKRHVNPALDVARECGVRHVVLLSLLGAEKTRVVPHRRIETHLEASGLDWTFLRASFFMQNLTTTHCAEIRDEGVIAVPAGKGRTSFVDARDIAAVAALALTAPGHAHRAWDLTGSEALSYAEVAAILSASLGRPIVYTDPSLLAFVRRMGAQGHPLGFALVTAAIYTTARLGRAGRVTGDVERLLGRPPITVARFARDHAACWQPATADRSP